MKTLTILFNVSALVLLCSCEKPLNENITEPKYFFQWDAQAQSGTCTNVDGVEGYNPRFVGPCGDLRGYDFRALSLDGVDLRGAMLDGMNLEGFSLNGTNLTAVKARGAIFSKARLNGANLSYGHFEGSRFDKAQLNGANLKSARFSGSSLDKASLYGANFKKSDLGGAKLSGNLNTVKFESALYSYGTKLPFDEKVASNRGMKSQNQINIEMAKIREQQNERLEIERAPASPEDDFLVEELIAKKKEKLK